MKEIFFSSRALLELLFFLAISCSATASASTDTKSELAATLPGCSQVARAIVAAYGPVASVDDVTKSLSMPGASPDGVPGVLRACRVHEPGYSVPFVINYDGPMPAGYLEHRMTLERRYGKTHHHAVELPGTDNAAAIYRIPQAGRGYLIKAQMNHIEISVLTPRQNAAQAEKIARKIIELKPDSPRMPDQHRKNRPASSSSAESPPSGGSAGVIHYAGGMNGSVHFDSSDCTVVDAPGAGPEQFYGMDAPESSVTDAASYNGPSLSVVPQKPGWTSVSFTPHVQSGGPNAMFFMQVINSGVQIEHNGDHWGVVFKGARVAAWLASNGQIQTSDKKAIVITGHVSCRKFD